MRDVLTTHCLATRTKKKRCDRIGLGRRTIGHKYTPYWTDITHHFLEPTRLLGRSCEISLVMRYCKALTDMVGPYGLVPTLLVYNALPRLGLPTAWYL